MKFRWRRLISFAATLALAGCATSEAEPSQKEKDKMARDQQRDAQKQAQQQEKMLRGGAGGMGGSGGMRRGR